MNLESINKLNIGLVLLSFALALVIPFELFLFSYAILGPLHYLTEISWLEKRNYFHRSKRDLWIPVFLCLLVSIFSLYFRNHSISTWFSCMAFFSVLIFISFDRLQYQLIGYLLTAGLSFMVKDWHLSYLLFLIFLPTLIHVYFFTGVFMFHGARSTKEKYAWIGFILFILCSFLIFIIPSKESLFPLTNFVADRFFNSFRLLHKEFLNLFYNSGIDQFDKPDLFIMFKSQAGWAAVRFFAFAYTYHYLNWFSKTQVIKWHEVSKPRIYLIAFLWLLSLAFYFWDYHLGFQVLFFLSLLHVILELPLNFITIKNLFIQPG
ncbi:MAG TPA: hypothetical protein PK006_01585 [Saprospiraceae bacterium]|nr:hypothetical protein [Saprospiraceae bacterium]